MLHVPISHFKPYCISGAYGILLQHVTYISLGEDNAYTDDIFDSTIIHFNDFSFNKIGSGSDMAIVDIGAVSGFEPQKDKVEMSPLIKRLEMPGNRLIIYFDEVGNSYKTFASVFTIKRPKSPWRLNREDTENVYSKYLSVYSIFSQSDSAIFRTHRTISLHRYIGCLHEIENQFFKKYG